MSPTLAPLLLGTDVKHATLLTSCGGLYYGDHNTLYRDLDPTCLNQIPVACDIKDSSVGYMMPVVGSACLFLLHR